MEKQTAQTTAALANHIAEGTCAEIKERYLRLIEAAKEADFGALDADVVVLDTETTGFSYNHDELIQIAAARMSGGGITDWYITFVNPGRPIPEEITVLTGIRDEDVAAAPAPEEALAGLVSFVGDSDIVAHNAEFDRTFTTKNAFGAALESNTWIDSLDLARIALPRLKSHRLLDLVHAFGAPVSTHRADDDVAALCAVYRILLAAVDAMPEDLVREIAGMADEGEWPSVKVFRHFAKHAEEGVPGEGDPKAGAGVIPGGHLNLRSMRARRIKDLEGKPRADADQIAADPLQDLVFPTATEIAEAYQPEGIVGGLYDSYELRGEQAAMAEAIRNAFSTSTNVVVEAGTGVGKSMAYLLTAALTAKRNNIAVGVATKTNTLLDQLVYKELPLLSRALGGLSFSSLKGFSHYPCLRHINRIVQDGPQTKTIAGKPVMQAPSLAALLSFVEQSEYDDIDALKIDYRVLPRYAITTASHDCLRRKCPYFGTTCFVHGARRRAESSDIIVTNHSLLFCDLMADGGLLPPIRYWVVDEAHGAEAEARRAFSLDLSAEEIMRLARRVSSDEPSVNAFIRAERRVSSSAEDSTLQQALFSKARAAGKAFAQSAEEFTAHIKDLAFFDTNKRNKGYEIVELWINEDIRGSATFANLAAFGKLLCDSTEKLISSCQELVALLDEIEEAAEAQREIASIAINLKEMLCAAEVILFKASSEYAYAATLSRKKDRVAESLQAMLLNVGSKMNETLYVQTHSVVFTSATLAVADSFDSFETALGLNESDASRTSFLALESSYDFDAQMTVYVVDDIPEPNDPQYLGCLEQLLVQVHRAQHGSMLTLFTNRKEMEKCYDFVQPALKHDDLRLVCQKWGVSAKGLRDDFLQDRHLSLFALKSFWEGFDAPGATLRGVVIPKLPFAKPTDPLSCERALRDCKAWSHFVLPAAVLETKQAAGRLIRGANDRGCLILADRRLITKGYGKTFLKSLPSRTIKICSTAAIVEELTAANAEDNPIQ